MGLLGGNGAGKSTLMKIAAGVHPPDAGTVSIDGQSPRSPADAIRLGVSLVRQELIQAQDLDVGSNVLLGHEPHRFGIIDRAALYSRASKALARVGGDIDPRMPLRRAVARPEAADGDRARALAGRQGAAARRAHRDAERGRRGAPVRRCSRDLRARTASPWSTSRIACARSWTSPTASSACATASGWPSCRPREATLDKLVELLAGTTNVTEAAPPAARAEVVLSVRGRVSFDLHAGEILGLAGLVGAGRSSVLRELFGVRPCELEVTVGGQLPVDPDTPRDAMAAGFALVPEERGSQGLILSMLVERNLALPSLNRFLLEDELADRPALHRPLPHPRRGAGVAPLGRQPAEDRARQVDGARAARCCCSTSRRGASTSRAKRDVHDVVRELAAAGKAIIVSSSEAEEIARLCHRAIVLGQGQIARRAGPRRAHRRQHPEVRSMSANMTEVPIPAEPDPRPHRQADAGIRFAHQRWRG